MTTAVTPATAQTVKLELHAAVDLGDGRRDHFAIVEASTDAGGHWTVRTEFDDGNRTTVSGEGERPEVVLADGAIHIRFGSGPFAVE